MMTTAHVLIYRPGPAWLPGRSVFQQALQPHLHYMHQLLQSRVLRIGGPFLDDSGGLVVVNLDTLQAARACADADPAVRDGIMQVDVHPWRVMSDELQTVASAA